MRRQMSTQWAELLSGVAACLSVSVQPTTPAPR